MHICFITNEYPKEGFPHGGVGTFVHTISHKLIEYGHQVSIIGINVYTKKNEYENENDIEIYRLKPKKIKGLTWLFNNKSINSKLSQVNALRPIDIIETAELGMAFIKKIPTVKYVIRLHGGHHFFAESENRKVSWWKSFQEKRSFKRADGFIAVSKYVKAHTEKFLSYNNKPLEVIRYPINLNLFKPRPEIQIKKSTVLFAGTICAKKGIDQLIRAIPKVIESNKDIQLNIYGRDWFFPNGKSYIEYIKESIFPEIGNAVNNIHFKGAVPLDVLAKNYAASEICVFPSLMETQGLVAPEAMAMEKLVVFSNCGPGPETIEDKKTGLLCDPYNPNDIAEKIIWALKHKNETKEIAKEGRKFVEEIFNIDTITNTNINFYYKIKN